MVYVIHAWDQKGKQQQQEKAEEILNLNLNFRVNLAVKLAVHLVLVHILQLLNHQPLVSINTILIFAMCYQ